MEQVHAEVEEARVFQIERRLSDRLIAGQTGTEAVVGTAQELEISEVDVWRALEGLRSRGVLLGDSTRGAAPFSHLWVFVGSLIVVLLTLSIILPYRPPLNVYQPRDPEMRALQEVQPATVTAQQPTQAVPVAMPTSEVGLQPGEMFAKVELDGQTIQIRSQDEQAFRAQLALAVETAADRAEKRAAPPTSQKGIRAIRNGEWNAPSIDRLSGTVISNARLRILIQDVSFPIYRGQNSALRALVKQERQKLATEAWNRAIPRINDFEGRVGGP